MSKHLILIFTRNPNLGKIKTRLAKTIGDTSALNIYKHLLTHTEAVVKNIDCDKSVYYSIKIRTNDIWDENVYQKHQQQGSDLGARMHNAFHKGFQGNYEKIVIVGSDLFDLKAAHINEAFKKLNTNDIVIGPAEDGGYYLLGMNSLHSKIFKNKNWGTHTVFKDTLVDLKTKKVAFLETLNDIDTYNDIKHNRTLKALINQ